MTNTEVVCVDGVGGVEAVVVRYGLSRLCAVNPPAFLSCDGSTQPLRAHIGDLPLDIRKIEPQCGDMLETGLECDEQKSKSEDVLTGLVGRDSRRTLIDRKLLS